MPASCTILLSKKLLHVQVMECPSNALRGRYKAPRGRLTLLLLLAVPHSRDCATALGPCGWCSQPWGLPFLRLAIAVQKAACTAHARSACISWHVILLDISHAYSVRLRAKWSQASCAGEEGSLASKSESQPCQALRVRAGA